MPCLFGIIGFFFPRLIMVALWLTTDYMSRAFQTQVWPVLGFIFAPFTTLAYAFGMNQNHSITGIYLGLVVFGALLDMGVIGGGGRHAKRRRDRDD